MSGHPLKANYYALVLAAEKDLLPETALATIDPDAISRAEIYDAETREMVRLRRQESLTYPQIGRLFGLHYGAVFKRIKRYLTKRGGQP